MSPAELVARGRRATGRADVATGAASRSFALPLGLGALVALPLAAQAGLLAVAALAGLLVLVVVVALLQVELQTMRTTSVVRGALWHPDDFVVLVQRDTGTVVGVEGGWRGLTSAAEIVGRPVEEVLVTPPFRALATSAQRRMRGDATFPAVWRAAGGGRLRSEAMAVCDGPDLVVYCRDVTEATAERDRLAQRAATDPLTGLPNRSLLDRSVRSAALSAARTGRHCAVALIDLDGFKGLNDRQGHAAGDVLLAAVSAALQGAARAGDDVLRLGGDEFLLVARDLSSRGAADLLVERTLAAVRHGSGHRLTASVGVVLVGGLAGAGLTDEPTDLVARADAAMYEAKRAGGDVARIVSVGDPYG